MAEPSGNPFRVCWSEKNRQRTLHLGRKAVQLGYKTEFVEALKWIVNRLMVEPTAWGDPLFRLPSTGMIIYH